MQFQVPQYIEVEDKIFGPLTFKQFIYMVGGAAAVFLLYEFLGVYVGAVPIIAVAGLAYALAFYKVNNRPFVNYLESAVRYTLSHKLYTWKKTPNQLTPTVVAGGKEIPINLPKLSESKLKDLTWSLDINDKIN